MASLKMGSSLGRCFLRGSRVASSTRWFTKFPTTIGLPHRQFASVSGSLRDAVPNNGGETQPEPPRLGSQDPSRSARSVVFIKLQSRVVPHEIESLLKEAGVNVKSVDMSLDIFRLRNTSYAVAELASEEEVPKAVNALHDKQLHERKLIVQGVKPDFSWSHSTQRRKLLVSTENMDLSQAVKPLLEGRRMIFKVEHPGWAPGNQKPSDRLKQNMDRAFSLLSNYGVECTSRPQPIWQGHPNEAKYFCTVDFETKAGAEEAIRALDNTKIDGKLVQLLPSVLSLEKERLLAKLDPKALAQLQNAGIKAREREISPTKPGNSPVV